MTGPANPPVRRFRITTEPTLAGRFEAPMTATLEGRSRHSRFRTLTERSYRIVGAAPVTLGV
jgi:hypothetical protein